MAATGPSGEGPPPLPRASRSAPIIERAPLPIIEVQGKTHVITHVNAAFCTLLGEPREALVGKPFCELVPGGSECLPLLDSVYQTGEAIVHAQHESAPTASSWLYAMWPALDPNDQPVGVIIQMARIPNFQEKLTAINEALLLAGLRQQESADVAEQLNRRLQREIAERKRVEERFRFMAESMPEKIFTATPEGRVDYLNEQWTKYTGLPLDTIEGAGWTRFLHPDELEESVRSWHHSLESGAHFQKEHRFRRADGVYRWHLSRALPMHDAEGRTLMWIGSSTDIHEQKQLIERLAAADRHKDEFLAMLAHELRTPLAPIRNAGYVLGLVKSDNATIVRAQEIIQRQAGHLARLVDDLLDVSRIQEGKVRIRKETMDLTRAVARAVDSCEQVINTQDHTITVDLQRLPPLFIDADPTRIEQILINLIGNAAKYTPSQGRIQVKAAREDGMAVVRVRDDGVGIAPDMLLRVFDVFTQVEQSLERSQGGLGLGLKLVKELVELHGGQVEARSAGLHKGSEFIVRLPLVEKLEPKSTPQAAAVPATSATPRRVLVVDDSRDSRETMEMLLTMFGHTVEMAEDGGQAVKRALEGHPDVAFVDIGLPTLNGYDVARQIRAGAGGDRIVLIALSGYGQAEDKRKAAAAGFDAHLTKPVDLEEVTKILNDLGQYHRGPSVFG